MMNLKKRQNKMWSVIKIDRKKIGFFKDEIKKKLGEDCEFYTPKLHIEGLKNNKKINKFP